MTPMALEKIKSYITEQKEEGASLRVMIGGMGCGGPQFVLTLEKEISEDDIKVQHDGLTVVIDPESAPMVDGSEIDYVETLEKSGFTVKNPNFQGHGCACGGQGCGCGHGH